MESVYGVVDRLYMVVNERSLTGSSADDLGPVSAEILTFPDPDCKVTYRVGVWARRDPFRAEALQRNAGLKMIWDDGFDYALIIDSDEVYDSDQLRGMLEYAFCAPYVDFWKALFFTYWKLPTFRVDPPEDYWPVVLVKRGHWFSSARIIAAPYTAAVIPEWLGQCSHLSYVRTDERMQAKLRNFAHAHEIIPGWYEDVWKAWDTNHEMENLHPVAADHYKRAVEVPLDSLPCVLREGL
jgi:hypothetical protein